MNKNFSLYLCLLVLAVPLFQYTIAEDICTFNITEWSAVLAEDPIYGENTIIQFDVSELIPVEDILYTLATVDELVSGDLNQDSTALQYVNATLGENENGNYISVYVTESMEGNADYDNIYVEELETLVLEFELYFLNYNCTLQIAHHTVDENTKSPEFLFTEPFCNVSIREDYPINLAIVDFEAEAVDYDGAEPNNEFEAIFNEGCPITTTELSYATPGGENVTIEFALTEALDYDNDIRQYICVATLQDFGTPSMNSSSIFIINVLDYNDESPIFEYEYYTGLLLSNEEGSTVTTLPLQIEATDQDNNATDPFLYSMEDAREDVEGSAFFEIDPDSGQVTLSQPLDSTFLSNNEHVEFILYATDLYNHTGKSFLLIELPRPLNGTYVSFDQYMYASQVISPEKNDVVLVISAHTTSEYPITYSIVNETIYFDIDSISGEIFCTQNYTPPFNYYFAVNAMVEEDNIEDFSLVNIYVVERAEGNEPMMLESLDNATIWENYTGFITQLEAEGTCTFCIKEVQPEEYFDYFTIGTLSGVINLTSSLEDDEVRDVTLLVACESPGELCATSQGYQRDAQIQNNEAIVRIKVKDLNDNAPSFGPFRDAIVAYPLDEALQRVDGVVIKVHATDEDTSDDLHFVLEDPSETFVIDSAEGNIYVSGPFDCDSTQGCAVHLYVYDSQKMHYDSTYITILGLPMNLISTMILYEEDVELIDQTLVEISNDIGANISQIYFTIFDDGNQNETRILFDILVHVYALDHGTLITTSELNEFLIANGYEEAREFTEMDEFQNNYTVTVMVEEEVATVDDERETSLEIAVVILGSLLGIILVTIIVYAICKKKNPPQKVPYTHFEDISRNSSSQNSSISYKPSSFVDATQISRNEVVHSAPSPYMEAPHETQTTIAAQDSSNKELPKEILLINLNSDTVEALPTDFYPSDDGEENETLENDTNIVLTIDQNENLSVDYSDAPQDTSVIQEELVTELEPISSAGLLIQEEGTIKTEEHLESEIEAEETPLPPSSEDDTKASSEGKTVVFKVLVEKKEYENEAQTDEEDERRRKELFVGQYL